MENYDYRVVVGIDFGITHSGFAYAHKRIKTVIVHSEWQEYYGLYKIPTVLLYDDKYDKVQSWGFNALKESNGDKKPIELFKLHLGNITNKPSLPNGFDYKKAIIDYLHEMGKIIKQVIINDWIDFYNHVLIVLTVPVEFDHTSIAIMRECAFKAGLLKDRYSRNLKFITEPEATMIHCMKSLNENLSVGETFMIVDCKGDTVNSTTIQLLEGERLNIMTERERNDCGDNFIDQEFLKFLERKVGSSTIKLIKENQYNQFQYMLKEFYRKVKMEFTGIQSEFRPINLELDELCPALIQYCDEKYFDNMKKIEWNIKLKFDDIKSMFDPIIEKILKLIERSNHNCTALLLIGILSESKYFQLRINQEFNNKIPIIYIPPNPITSIMEGAVRYGLERNNNLDCNGDSTLECVAPYTNNMRLQLTQSYDTIKNLEKEKNKLQNEIQESNKNLNKYRSLCDNLKKEHDELVNKNDEYKEQEQYLNDMWTQSSDTIKKLEEEKKKFQEEIQKYDNKLNEFRSLYDGLKKKYDGLVNENDEYKEQEQRLNDMQFQSSDTIKKLEEEKEKFQGEIQKSINNLNEYRSLYDNLMKKYDGLVNENDEYKEKEQRLNELQIQSSNIIKKLEEEKKKLQDEIQELASENKEKEQRLNDMQIQTSDTIKKLEEEKEKFQDEIRELVNENKEQEQHFNNTWIQSSDTIIKLEEEKEQLQDEIQELVNENKEQEQRLNDTQNQSSDTIKKLEEEKKKLQDEIQELANENKEKEQRLNDMQIQISDTIKKLEEEKKKFQDEIRELINENKEQEQHFNDTQVQSSDTIIKLEEEKEKLQDEIQELINENKEQEQRLNDTQNQSSDTIKKLEEEKKKLQDEIQELANENKEKEHHLNDMQIQTSDTIKKLEEEKEKFQDEIRELINENKEKEQHFNNTRIQSSDTIIKLEEEKEKLQDEIQELINENKEQEQRLNDTQNQSSDTIKKLEEEKKKLQDEIQELVNENKDLNDMQIQSSDTIEKLEEEKKKLQDDIQEYDNDSNKYKSSYNNLQEKYNELTNKNNEETNQNQKLKNEINQINDINQQYIEKIDQLQQSLQNLEKEKEELDAKNYNLYYQLERLVQQNELKNELLLDDDCQNHALKLNDDILGLNDNIKIYITDLKQDVTVNMEEIKKLLLLYECPTKITNQDDDRLLIQAVLQRHIIETIFLFATKYFQTTEQCYHLESDIINKTSSLYNLLNKISKQRAGNEEVSHVASIKLRQQIYSILNNHGFCDIIGDGIYEHPFIVHHKEQLNKIMNELRIIEDDQEKIASENLAATIIREFVRIFWFRLIVQEPVVQYAWIPHNAKMDKTLMEGTNLDDNENLHVDLCYFPLTGRDLASKNRKIYTPAKVFTRKD